MPRFRLLSVISAALIVGACAEVRGLLSRDDQPEPLDPIRPGTVEVSFTSDGNRLNGFVYTAAGSGPHPTVVLLHGYPGNEKNLDLAQDLRASGFNVLFFHYRGAWGSEGEFGFNNVIADVAAALSLVRERAADYRADTNRLLLIGHSMGGFAALQGAANDDDVRCVAGLASWDVGGTADLIRNNEELRNGWKQYSDTLQMLAGWSGDKAASEMLANANDFNLLLLAPRLQNKHVLLIAAADDTVVPVPVYHSPMVNAYKAQDGLRLTHDIIPGDHAFSWSRAELSAGVVDWARKCAALD